MVVVVMVVVEQGDKGQLAQHASMPGAQHLPA
jgi:hypothetical protein